MLVASFRGRTHRNLSSEISFQFPKMHINVILLIHYNYRSGPLSFGFTYYSSPHAYLLKSTIMNLFPVPFSVKMFEQALISVFGVYLH